MRVSDFERIYAEHGPGIVRFLAYRAGSRAVAEDLAAEAFERIYRTRRRFDPRRASEKTWVYAVAMNCLRDHLRRELAERRALERVAPLGARGGDEDLEQIEDRDSLQRAIAVLSDPEREVLALRYGGDLTVPEIARVIGTSRTTAEGRLYGALRKLRDELTSGVGDAGGVRSSSTEAAG
jgi:RNA polymerase sigma factor (sigma-70 family)